jgi:hypothetical protein
MRTSLVLTLTVAALALPAAALAKGPDHASISGPGISGSIRVDGDGEEGGTGTPLGALVAYGGYPSQVFGHHPADPTTRARPAGHLGPRYEIVYSVPTPTGRRSIDADLYPYATPRPVTYMKPGQPFFGAMQTYGGWYVGKPGLKQMLSGAGLFKHSSGSAGSHTWRWIGGGVFALAALAAASMLLFRRRPQSAPARAS